VRGSFGTGQTKTGYVACDCSASTSAHAADGAQVRFSDARAPIFVADCPLSTYTASGASRSTRLEMRGHGLGIEEQRSSQGQGSGASFVGGVVSTEGDARRGRNAKPRRGGWGLLAGLAVFGVVAIPAGWSAYFSLVSFTGCFIECTEPAPGVAAMWASMAILLLALPIATGLIVARVPLRRGWPWLVGLAGLLLLGATYAQRVI
jgi:hypothetical protein